MLDTLGRVVGRHPWWFVVAWLAASVLALAAAIGGVFGESLFERLTSGAPAVPGETREGQALIDATSDSGPTALLLLDGIDLTEPELERALDEARADLRAIPGVVSVNDPFAGGDTLYDEDSIPYIAEDQRAVLVSVEIRRTLPAAEREAALERARDRLAELPDQLSGTTGLVGGLDVIIEEVTDQVETDLRTGEGIALPISLLIMVVVFGGFLAAGLPILGALAAIAGALATLLGFSYLVDLDASTVNVVTVLGLGLCIDYGLLLVSRYREEMHALPGDPALPPTRRQRELALRRTMTSAGRTVLFSGITVAIALSGLLLFRADILRAIGAAGVSVVAVALLVALTLVPALLALVRVRMIRPGLVHRIPGLSRVVHALGDVAPAEGFFSRLARGVQRFPLIVLLASLAALFVMSLPVARMELTSSGTALLPRENDQRQLFEGLSARFPFAAPPAVQVVTRATPEQVADLVDDIAALPTVTSVDPPSQQGDGERGRVTVIPVRVVGAPSGPAAREVVERIRAMEPGYPIWTTGDAAALLDYLDDLRKRAPLAVGVVVLATFVLLFLMTGSLLVPIKALFMNVVSLGASLGVLVWAFQDGALEGLLGFASAGGIETFIPPLTLAFGFGLAMDYEVFLLSRIAEYRRQGLSNDDAVAFGLQRSGRIITSAALIIVVVFAGFVAGELLLIKQTGLALAVAVAVDATLVRMLLVPATMTLLGEWNWWAPGPLRRLHDRYGLRD